MRSRAGKWPTQQQHGAGKSICDGDEVIPGKRTTLLTKDRLTSEEGEAPSPAQDRAMPRVDSNPFLSVLKVPPRAGGRLGYERSLASKALCTQ